VAVLDASQGFNGLQPGNSSQLEAFYLVVSARTGALSSDAHAVSGVRLECRPAAAKGTFVENWDGPRQPFIHLASPPPASPPPPSPPPSPVIPVRSAAALGGISFAVAFSVSLGALAGAFHVWRRPKGGPRSRSEGGKSVAEEAGPLLEDQFSVGIAAAPCLQPNEVDGEADAAFDVFLSYRRADYWLADTVSNKLRLIGLRVFKDVEGCMAGMPFGPELVKAVRAAPVYAPVITLQSLQRLASAADAGAAADASLGEALLALYFRSTGDVRLIHPLLAGDPPPPPGPGCLPGTERWVPLNKQREYVEALEALPDAVASATHAAVSAALLSAFGFELPAEFAALTVRDIMCGRKGRGDAAPAMAGVLSGPALFTLDCLGQDLGFYILERYAPPAVLVAAEAAAARRKAGASLAVGEHHT
jgi:hypothetical protein